MLFKKDEESRAPALNPDRHAENMQNLPKLRSESCSCETQALPAAQYFYTGFQN